MKAEWNGGRNGVCSHVGDPELKKVRNEKTDRSVDSPLHRRGNTHPKSLFGVFLLE
jgi:hypothetical protein